MNEQRANKRIALWIILAVVVAGSAGGAAFWMYGGDSLKDDLTSGDAERVRAALVSADPDSLKGKDGLENSRLTVEAMKRMSVAEMMSMWERDDLTEEQRRNLGRNMRTAWMNQMGQIADEFYAASPEEKEAILDRQIDEFQEFRKKMEEFRQARENDPDAEEREQERRDRWRGAQSTEDRKDRMAAMSPDQQMKMMNMFTAMRQRASERGIEMGFGPGGRGGRGGPGGPGRPGGRNRGGSRGGQSGN